MLIHCESGVRLCLRGNVAETVMPGCYRVDIGTLRSSGGPVNASSRVAVISRLTAENVYTTELVVSFDEIVYIGAWVI